MVNASQQRMSVEIFRNFYAWRPDEERWELSNGVATKLATSTRAHQRIASNLQFGLMDALCDREPVLTALQRVAINIGPSVKYDDPSPDVVVIDDIVGVALDERYADRFYLVAEIVSASDRVDVERKREVYKLHESCTCILIVQQDRMEVQVDLRAETGWVEQILKEPDDMLALPDFGLRCKVSDLYRGTPLVPRQPLQRSS
jgi:Putative restriction endonuclease